MQRDITDEKVSEFDSQKQKHAIDHVDADGSPQYYCKTIQEL